MFKNLVLALLVVSLAPALASAKGNKGNPTRCAERVRQHCYLSNHDFDRIEENVSDCKQVNDQGLQLEAFQLRDAGKLVVVNTKTFNQYCSSTKYTIDYAGIKTMKVIAGKLFLLANSGRVYVVLSDEGVFEMLNARGRSYSNVLEIKGADSGNAIRLIGPGYDNIFTLRDISEKAYRGQFRKLTFIRNTTNRSIFRDE